MRKQAMSYSAGSSEAANKVKMLTRAAHTVRVWPGFVLSEREY